MTSIPRKIHQSWATTDYLKWEARLQVWRTSWSSQTDFEYRLWGDRDCESFIKDAFPNLVDVYEALPTNAERADLFRYCLLLKEGGVWVDLDTTCMEPLASWPLHDCSLLVGVQATGATEEERGWLGMIRTTQICQWTIGAAPGHPVFKAVIETIEKRVRAEIKHNKTLLNNEEAMFNRTGMGVWTDCVLASLTLPNPNARWETVLVEPFEQGGTRVLPMRAFAWDKSIRRLPKSQSWDRVLVRHHFMQSWKEPAHAQP